MTGREQIIFSELTDQLRHQFGFGFYSHEETVVRRMALAIARRLDEEESIDG